MKSKSAVADFMPENDDCLLEKPRELVFRYGWRTVVVNLGGVFVLALLVIVSGVGRSNNLGGTKRFFSFSGQPFWLRDLSRKP